MAGISNAGERDRAQLEIPRRGRAQALQTCVKPGCPRNNGDRASGVPRDGGAQPHCDRGWSARRRAWSLGSGGPEKQMGGAGGVLQEGVTTGGGMSCGRGGGHSGRWSRPRRAGYVGIRTVGAPTPPGWRASGRDFFCRVCFREL